jgi:hypothetical protein
VSESASPLHEQCIAHVAQLVDAHVERDATAPSADRRRRHASRDRRQQRSWIGWPRLGGRWRRRFSRLGHGWFRRWLRGRDHDLRRRRREAEVRALERHAFEPQRVAAREWHDRALGAVQRDRGGGAVGQRVRPFTATGTADHREYRGQYDESATMHDLTKIAVVARSARV